MVQGHQESTAASAYPMTKTKLRNVRTIQSNYHANGIYLLHITIFFHPDYTVGFGISPNHAIRLVGYTTGRESHPALKISFQFFSL